MTFVGQFIDHDLTFDATSKLGIQTEPTTSPNGRTPRFDLDSVYGDGPVIQSELYDPADPIKLRLESGGLFEDLPRRADGTAIVADPRNDSNLMISGLHAAFLQFHNHAVDEVRTAAAEPIDVYLEARRLTTWHYQWLVVHQFLPGLRRAGDRRCGAARPAPHYRPGAPGVRAGGVFRGGLPVRPQHGAAVVPSQPRRRRWRHAVLRADLRPRVAVADGAVPTAEPGDLRGGFRAPRRFVGWQTFFDFGGALHRGRPAQQGHRHRAVDSVVRVAVQCHRAPGR